MKQSPIVQKTLIVTIAILLLFLAGQGSPVETSTSERMNIVFLLADDLRWNTLGCTGDRVIQTPNLDALSTRGTLFENHFVTTAICAVSRASILSGQYARRHRIGDFDSDFPAAAFAQTYAALLRAAGYRTGFIGKYGVGKTMPAGQFDYWRGFPGQGSYFEKNDSTHLTRKMGDQALEFLNGDRSRPFCLSVSFKAPHAQDNALREFPPDPRDETLYTDASIPVPRTANESFFQLLPKFVQESEGRTRWARRFADPDIFQRTARDYYRLITGMDREVGRVLNALRALDVGDKTLVVFSSDNGFFLGERGMADKWLMYEPSIRVPLIVFDPTQPARSRGSRIKEMTLNIDFAPTFLDYAGVAVSPSMQGRSLRPLIGGRRLRWRTDWFYEHHTLPKIIPPSEGVRTERWKYLRWMDVEPVAEELYDLRWDPQEEHNVAGTPGYEKVLTQLRNRWVILRRELE
ncbi:MAG TPA: sulfatase [Acidobacteriota bacterium]